MKVRNEYMLCGGKKVLYAIIGIDGIPIYSEHWHGKRGRDAIRKIAKTFNNLTEAKSLLTSCAILLLADVRTSLVRRRIYNQVNAFLEKTSER